MGASEALYDAQGPSAEEGVARVGVKDGQGPFCERLGKEVPDAEFLSGSTPMEFERITAEVQGRHKRVAYQILMVVEAVVVAISSAVLFMRELRDVFNPTKAFFDIRSFQEFQGNLRRADSPS